MLKIQGLENNKFDIIKKFHKIKYFNKIEKELMKKSSSLNKNGYIKEVQFLESLKINLADILIGEPKKIESIKAQLHSDYENIKDNKIKLDKDEISMEKLIAKIFNYKDFSNDKLYYKSIDNITNWKLQIKNRERAGLSKGKYDINKLRESIIKSIKNISEIYIDTVFDISDVAQQWEKEVRKFVIPDVNNISDKDLKIFDDMKMNLVNNRNEFWGNYNDFRGEMKHKEVELFWGGYNFVKEIGLMTCPYCNRIYTNLIIGKKKSYKPALDHFYAESIYPYLALSLFNLIPSCDICNSSFKSNNSIEIHNLYSAGFENEYLFKYEKIDDSKALSNANITIKIESKNGKWDKNIDNNITVFELESAYTTHKDIVVKMCKQREKYTDSEIQRLVDGGFFTSKANFIEQAVLNGPIEKEKFHEVPLAKFKRDIAYQLGFLKNL
jgi:hypothetical protein